MNNSFVPHHMNACTSDFEGNGKWGRYILLPGSDGRAAEISSTWENVTKKESSRAHNLYLGTMSTKHGEIDVATISTGMGAPSTDIILNELRLLGAKNFIRVGTAGSLQPSYIRRGAIVVPTGSVRDEGTTSRYVPLEVPAVPSLEFLIASKLVEKELTDEHPVYFGLVHSKDSLYAREFHAGPKSIENETYMKVLSEAGVVASEMESSMLFVLGEIFKAEDIRQKTTETLTGALFAIIGDDTPFGDKDKEKRTINVTIDYAFKIIEKIHEMRKNY